VPKHNLTAQGGTRAAAIYSGANAPGLTAAPNAVAVGSDVLFWSGAGRLAEVVLHGQQAAGTGITFYDAAAPISGGPIYTSGHVPLAFIAGNTGQAVVSGQPTLAGGVIPIGMPFRYGLCVNSRSGQIGYTVSWSPD